jgi:(2Fe-2S) ferredoxin
MVPMFQAGVSIKRSGQRDLAKETSVEGSEPQHPHTSPSSGSGGSGESSDREQALSCLEELGEETMQAAWGAQRTAEERRRIVQAALILGRKLDERLAERGEELHPDEAQRFLMALINDTVKEFARQESLDPDDAANFLSDVGTRDLILEFNEVLEASRESGRPLDDQLRQIVEDRQDRAIWSDHWSSG